MPQRPLKEVVKFPDDSERVHREHLPPQNPNPYKKLKRFAGLPRSGDSVPPDPLRAQYPGMEPYTSTFRRLDLDEFKKMRKKRPISFSSPTSDGKRKGNQGTL